MKGIAGLVVVGMVVIAVMFMAIAGLGETDITNAQWNTHCIREHGADTDGYFLCLAQCPSWTDN